MAEQGCPVCERPLVSGRLGPVPILACQACAGVWLKGEDLARVVQAGAGVVWRLCEALRATAAGRRAPGPPRGCPSCRVPLVAQEFPSMPGLALTHCRRCGGFWLDEPLLCRLAGRLTEEEQKRPPAPAAAVGMVAGTRRLPPGGQPQGASGAQAEDHSCPGCGQPNSPGAPVCWACGRLLKGAAAGKCPRCEGTLHRLYADTVAIDACDGCGGVWLEHGRLGALMLQDWDAQDRLLQDVARTRTGRIRKRHVELFCPQCKLLMFATPMTMLTNRPVDACPRCSGTFLDEGALNSILIQRRSVG